MMMDLIRVAMKMVMMLKLLNLISVMKVELS